MTGVQASFSRANLKRKPAQEQWQGPSQGQTNNNQQQQPQQRQKLQIVKNVLAQGLAPQQKYESK